MSITSLPSPGHVAAPGFAAVAADWFARLLEVLHLARRIRQGTQFRYERIAEASALRRYADALRDVDPRYAADLYAAADRHDRDV